MNQPTDPHGGHRGFDAAVKRREDDHLNRWPLAREIYGISVTGPCEWSVRVGIYGEWGTGKTSVLEFIAGMAEKDRHVVIWFDPWEHSTKQELWRSFVLAVYDGLESKFGRLKDAEYARWKARFDKAKEIVKTVTATVAGAWNQTAGKLVENGLDYVKEHLAFSQEDLASLKELLGDKRVIILIDDLDRTAPELVPEILFALKELMDTPGFSYICAFDPVVVGKVLRQYHRGFGDGLKFLEKIIDYPRWLPPATAENLTKLAIAESKRFCEFVPADSIRDAVGLLPPNPRAIRQFIRLLALLKPQIYRHYDNEIYWPVIIAANVIKVRYPRIAHELLSKKGFWEKISASSYSIFLSQKSEKIETVIEEHLKSVTTLLKVTFDATQQKEVLNALVALYSKIDRWPLRGTEFVFQQIDIAENPQVVTEKEYDQFVAAWTVNQSAETARIWITTRAQVQECTEELVYREAFSRTVYAYAKALNMADDTFAEADRPPLVTKSESLISLLECLAFDLGHLDQEEKRLTVDELTLLLQKIAPMVGAVSNVYFSLLPRNENLLLQICQKWRGDVTMLLDVLQPYSYSNYARAYQGVAVQELHQKLCAVVLPQLARQVMDGFRRQGFVDRFFQCEKDTLNDRGIILDLCSPFWSSLRSETIVTLSEASSNQTIQANVYELFNWFDHKLSTEQGFPDSVSIRKLLSDNEIFNALWYALTASPLSNRAAARLNRIIAEVQKQNISVEFPHWWPKPVLEGEESAPESMDEEKRASENYPPDLSKSDLQP